MELGLAIARGPLYWMISGCASLAMPELNWSGTYTYRAKQLYRPDTIDELQRLIEVASGSLHALGTRHSFNDIADADGISAPGSARRRDD